MRCPDYIARRTFAILLSCWLLLLPLHAAAQNNIPLGSWRMHLSYNAIHHVETSAEHIFAAANSGIMVYDRANRSLTTYNRLNGLNSTGISSLKFDDATRQLLVGYGNGALDIISGNTVANFERLRDADIATTKAINHISTLGNSAFLSTAYGVVVFDLQHLEIKETWRDLGPSGEELAVFSTAFLNDSIYLATASGILAGNLDDNLLDFNNWTRSGTGNPPGPVQEIATFNHKLYAAGATGLYRYNGSTWMQESFAQSSAIRSVTASEENLFIIFDGTVWSFDRSGTLSEIAAEAITAPAVVKQDETGDLWIGDEVTGLVSNAEGQFSSYLPDGPTIGAAHKLVYAEEKLYLLPGGFSPGGEPLHIRGDLNYFEDGQWNATELGAFDLTDLAVAGEKVFVSTFGSGLLVSDPPGTSAIDESNSPLFTADGAESRVTALAPASSGLWVANYGGNHPLHLLKNDGTWSSFSFGYPNEQHPTNMALDGKGNIWMSLNPASGGGLIVMDINNNQTRLITSAEGSGRLPDGDIYSIAADREGYIWVGTEAGVAYFFSTTEDAIKPIYENRFLLRDEKVTAVAIDAGNRKWLGTEQGAWLFNPTGERLVHHFTTENSPLLSDQVRDIEINHSTGEVFFATDMGIISYRSDAMEATVELKSIRIFPNPVTPGYSGTVGISGLSADASVRITDISGKLVWQTRANGGIATWNVRDHSGRRVATGVYLVFASNQDGSESVVGKLAVIE
jgi:ligand-binding sensor domain-containing protein